jgi:RimJ/RimL family protein N-acetyltransferase
MAPRPEHAAYIFDVETLPSYKGRGYATRFLSNALSLIREWGMAEVYVRVLPDNRHSRAAFARLGFQDVGGLSELFVGGRRLAWWRA